jgi:hypothetical protein
MTILTIPYTDLGTLSLARVDGTVLWTNITQLANTLLNALNAAVVIDTTSGIVPASGGAATPFWVNNSNFTSFTYSSGVYPVGNIHLEFNNPANVTDFGLDFSVTFFDSTRVTLAMVKVPTVTINMDINNINQQQMDLFIAGVLSVGFMVGLNEISYSVWDNNANVE